MNLAYMNRFRYWLIVIIIVCPVTTLAQDINLFWKDYADYIECLGSNILNIYDPEVTISNNIITINIEVSCTAKSCN